VTRLRPRRLVHQGVVEATGLVIDRSRVGEARAQRRVLALWEPGARLYERGERWVLVLPSARRVTCVTAPGAPLVAEAGGLSALPLSEAERALVGEAALLVAEAGAAVASDGLGEPVDPASWLDVSGLAVARVTDLGAPPPPPVVAVTEVEDAPERLLGTDATLEDGRAPAITALVEAARRAAQQAERRAATAWASGGGGVASRGGLRGRAESVGLPGPFETGGGLWRRVRGWLARRLLRRALGRQHGRYLAETLRLFDEGRLDEALRHAIPLDDSPTAADADGLLGRPRPRFGLRVTAGTGGGTLGLMEGLFDALERRYQVALNRLKADGRIAEAAFVLAELLGRPEQAVSLLEGHELYAEAADIAEVRRLDPALVVRLRLLAGDVDRARALARRHGVYAPVVEALERARHPLAGLLRWEWALHLARAGALEAAVDVAWRLEERRETALSWVLAAIARGGPGAAGLLGRWLTLRPDDFPAVAAYVADVAVAGGPEAARSRILAALSLAGSRAAGAANLVRPLVRGLVRDAASDASVPGPLGTSVILREVLDNDRGRLGDLRHATRGLPLAPDLPVLRSCRSPLTHDVTARGAGAAEVTDAALLPDGRVLVALGELGARVLRPDGRVVASFRAPAHALSVADTGRRALALARRGSVTRLTELDLDSRRSRDLGEIVLDGVADTYDGARLFGHRGGAVTLLDVLAPRPTELWGVGDLGGPIAQLARDARAVSVLVTAAEGPSTVWRWDAESLRLTHRDEVQPHGAVLALGADAGMVQASTAPPNAVYRSGPRSRAGGPLGAAEGNASWGGLAMVDGWIAGRRALAGARDEWATDVAELVLFDTAARGCRLVVRVSPPSGHRLSRWALVVFDDRGRVLAIELETGAVVADLAILGGV